MARSEYGLLKLLILKVSAQFFSNFCNCSRLYHQTVLVHFVSYVIDLKFHSPITFDTPDITCNKSFQRMEFQITDVSNKMHEHVLLVQWCAIETRHLLKKKDICIILTTFPKDFRNKWYLIWKPIYRAIRIKKEIGRGFILREATPP